MSRYMDNVRCLIRHLGSWPRSLKSYSTQRATDSRLRVPLFNDSTPRHDQRSCRGVESLKRGPPESRIPRRRNSRRSSSNSTHPSLAVPRLRLELRSFASPAFVRGRLGPPLHAVGMKRPPTPRVVWVGCRWCTP